MVLVEKKYHSTRFCVDYRAFNDITSKDSYPLPRIDDCFDALGSTTWLSSIDLQSGYWQVAMDPDSIDKTAFSCQSGLFQFRVLPFGVCNGPPRSNASWNMFCQGYSGKYAFSTLMIS